MKKMKGRKQHLLVETQGWVFTVQVHPAGGMDRDGVMLLLPPEPTQTPWPRLAHVGLEAGFHSASAKMGRGTDLLLARTKPALESRRRTVMYDQ